MAETVVAKAATISDHCRIAPPSDCTAVQSLPLSFFDILFIYVYPTQRLLFYQFPCSDKHFQETIVPNIKNSLSQTLKHFLPLAGNLICPLNSGFPGFRYVPGDSVSLTIARSNEASDFNYLTGDGPRDADEFHCLVPDLPNPKIDFESGVKIIPVFAVQVTIFPEIGICIGFTNHHSIADASSMDGFMKTWSSISRQIQGDVEFLAANSNSSVPLYDRSMIKDPSGIANTFWSEIDVSRIDSLPLLFPLNKVRTTFSLLRDDIQKLKNLVQSKKTGLNHLTSFIVTTAYVWTCLVKSGAEVGEDVDDTEPEYFVLAVDARPRLDPPLPADYFGNCIVLNPIESSRGELKGENGFLTAVKLMSELISKKVNNNNDVLRDAKNLTKKMEALVGKRVFGVSGSPRFDFYDSEFGWGKPVRYEAVSIDVNECMSLSRSRVFKGGFEIGLSLPNKKMDAFAAIFKAGLKM